MNVLSANQGNRRDRAATLQTTVISGGIGLDTILRRRRRGDNRVGADATLWFAALAANRFHRCGPSGDVIHRR